VSEVTEEFVQTTVEAPGEPAEQAVSSEPEAARPTLPWAISARTPTGLPAQAARLHEYLTDPEDLFALSLAGR